MFIDTNYFLRFLLKDVDHQHEEVKTLFFSASEGEIRLLTSTIVFFEVYWVLSSYYKRDKDEVIEALQKILDLQFIIVEEREILRKTLLLFQTTSLDMEDCYNMYYAKSRGVKPNEFKTFDKKLAREFNK